MINFYYIPETKNLYPSSDISIDISINDDAVCLAELFAYFVEFTRMIGYHEGSWDNLINEVNSIIQDESCKDYSMYSWAIDTIGGI